MKVTDMGRKRAWTAGYMAHGAGTSIDACPRERGTIYYDDWCDGWNEAHIDFEGRTPAGG